MTKLEIMKARINHIYCTVLTPTADEYMEAAALAWYVICDEQPSKRMPEHIVKRLRGMDIEVPVSFFDVPGEVFVYALPHAVGFRAKKD